MKQFTKALIICITTCLYVTKTYSQTICLKYPIFLDVNKQYIELFNPNDSSVVTNLSSDSSKLMKAFNINKAGDLNFQILNDSGGIRIEGHYAASPLLHTETIYIRKLGGKSGSKHRTFYRPLRDGIWLYRDRKGTVYFKERYSNGRLLEATAL